MIVHLYNHPHHAIGVRVAHQAPDFYANNPENHPVTVRAAELTDFGAARYVNLTFTYIGKEADGTLAYSYKETQK